MRRRTAILEFRDVQERMFDLFQRGADNEAGGLGIGLSLCKRIVDLHDGKIWIDRDYSGGCRVMASLGTFEPAGTEPTILPRLPAATHAAAGGTGPSAACSSFGSAVANWPFAMTWPAPLARAASIRSVRS